MRKYIFLLALLSIVTVARADEVVVRGCMNPKALNYNALATQDDSTCRFPVGNGDPMAVPQPWGINTYQAIAQGLFLHAGQKDCPIWYKMGCIDVGRIENYQQKMINWYYKR